MLGPPPCYNRGVFLLTPTQESQGQVDSPSQSHLLCVQTSRRHTERSP